MIIRTNIDVLPLVNATIQAQRNLVYSTVQGINATAKAIQDAQRARLDSEFVFRSGPRRDFISKQIAVIKPFASVNKGVLYAEIAIGDKKRLLLSRFEAGGERPAFVGSKVAVPVVGSEARPTFGSIIPNQFMFKNLKLRATAASRRATRRAGGRNAVGSSLMQFVGTNGQPTFLVKGVGVFLRTGSMRRDVELLYAFHANEQLKPKLQWLQTARNVADQWLSENITRAFLRSLNS